jgi:hypothetical protein
MADDAIKAQFSIELTNGSLTDNYSSGQVVADQVTALLVRNVQTIPFASHAALDLGDVATPGWAVFKNLSTTDFVQVGIDVGATFYPFLTLEPGEQMPCHLGTTAPYALADTATVDLFYIIYNT